MPNPTDSSDSQHDSQVEVDHSPKPAHATTGSSTTPRSRLTKVPKMVANGSRAFMWYALAIIIVIIDQWTKWLAETKLTFHDPVPVPQLRVLRADDAGPRRLDRGAARCRRERRGA